nr:MAG TPA_asm: hypothetical protein [Caudoviricetes sp.]
MPAPFSFHRRRNNRGYRYDLPRPFFMFKARSLPQLFFFPPHQRLLGLFQGLLCLAQGLPLLDLQRFQPIYFRFQFVVALVQSARRCFQFVD